ncbi:arylamine N-acetyltransferase-like [Haemaphysalis longicornis]
MDALTAEQKAAYLARIGVLNPGAPDLNTLRVLVDEHLKKVTFENIDVLLGRRIDLDANSLFSKIVQRGRGGYCFELNSLFARLLRSMGYSLRLRMARVRWGMPRDTPHTLKQHLVLIVDMLGEEYLVDVGFGGPNIFVPLPLATGLESADHPFTLRALNDADGCESGTLELRVRRRGDFLPIYRIEPRDTLWEDIAPFNWYASTHPHSRMRRFLEMGRSDSDGMMIIENGRYRKRRHSAEWSIVEEWDIHDVDELLSIFRDKFCLQLCPDKDVQPLRALLTDILHSSVDH